MTDTFGKRVQAAREKKGLTLEGLATAIDSTKSYVWELENKPTIRPSAELALRLAKALGTTVEVLMGEQEMASLPEKDQVFFRNYQTLKPDTKKQLAKIMDALMDDDKDP